MKPSSWNKIRSMSAASAARRITRTSCSTSAAIASSRSRRRSSISGTKSCPTTSSSARACRGSIYQRQILRLSAARLRGACESGRRRKRAVHGVLRLRQALSGPAIRTPSINGCATSSANGCSAIFFKTYTEKVWGMSCDDISADWAAQRIKGLCLGAAILDGLRRSLGLSKARNRRQQRQDPDRILPLSPQGPRHDVGGRRRARS